MPFRCPPTVMMANRRLDLVVYFRVDDAVGKVHAAGVGQRRPEPVLAQRRPVLGVDQIEAVGAEPGGLAALVVERQLGVVAESDPPQALLDPVPAPDRCLRLQRR
jgi:hypothetical protein